MELVKNIYFLDIEGKTHSAISVSIESSCKKKSTYFIKCHDLIQNPKRAKEESSLEVRFEYYVCYQFFIIDEVGYFL